MSVENEPIDSTKDDEHSKIVEAQIADGAEIVDRIIEGTYEVHDPEETPEDKELIADEVEFEQEKPKVIEEDRELVNDIENKQGIAEQKVDAQSPEVRTAVNSEVNESSSQKPGFFSKIRSIYRRYKEDTERDKDLDILRAGFDPNVSMSELLGKAQKDMDQHEQDVLFTSLSKDTNSDNYRAAMERIAKHKEQ